jgi:endonuclease/exonuclease/phosphatase family metal-dependent hydrolase
MLVRTWNLFHGNSVPPGRTAYLEEMVRLAVEDRPDVLLLQELPLWALPQLGSWTGMMPFAAVASRAALGASLGGTLTALNPGLLRSAVSGQGNAVLLDRSFEPFDYHELVLNPRRFRRDVARRLVLGPAARLAWAKERRVAQTIRAEIPDGRRIVVTNLHATNDPPDRRIADQELRRAAEFAQAIARPGEVEIIGGDFNALPGSVVIDELRGQGFSAPGRGVDHILVRGAASSVPERWADERRRLGGQLLSDHAPLEVRVE